MCAEANRRGLMGQSADTTAPPLLPNPQTPVVKLRSVWSNCSAAAVIATGNRRSGISMRPSADPGRALNTAGPLGPVTALGPCQVTTLGPCSGAAAFVTIAAGSRTALVEPLTDR